MKNISRLVVRVLTPLGLVAIAILLLSSCSNNKPEEKDATLTKEKYTSLVSHLKAELSSISDISWDFKNTKDISNSDISKGVLIELFPKSAKDSLALRDTYISSGRGNKDAQLKIKEFQEKVAGIAKKLPNDNIEISLGFESQQKSKGIVPIAESIKSMNPIPIH